jgi:hypothetical protein
LNLQWRVGAPTYDQHGLCRIDAPTSLVSMTLALARCLVEVPDPQEVAEAAAKAEQAARASKAGKAGKAGRGGEPEALVTEAPVTDDTTPKAETRVERAARLARWCQAVARDGSALAVVDEAEAIIAQAEGAATDTKRGKAKRK